MRAPTARGDELQYDCNMNSLPMCPLLGARGSVLKVHCVQCGMHRRHFAQGLLAGVIVLASSRAEARCAPLPLRLDAAQSRYVFEGVIETVSERDVVFRVVATWKGTPPARTRVRFSGRTRIRQESIGQTFVVFARGESDDALSWARCGATGTLNAALTAELTAAGLTRRVMP
jgi:hypothetical protein